MAPPSACGRAAAADAAPTAPRPASARRSARTVGDVLYIIDQRRLPDALVEVEIGPRSRSAYAIREMVVRGAPAIGQVAAIGLALTADRAAVARPYARRATSAAAANALTQRAPDGRQPALGGRPADGPLRGASATSPRTATRSPTRCRAEADAIVAEATDDHGRLATSGLDDRCPRRRPAAADPDPLQHGPAGLRPVRHRARRRPGRAPRRRALHVWVDETRPSLQGARLTAWELRQAGVPHTLIPDVAAGHLMARGEVDVVLVGADRIAANGDTANKIGTYTLAVLAARHGIPFSSARR